MELNRLRADLAETLGQSCTRTRTVRTPDGLGGLTASSTSTATYACRLHAGGITEGVSGDRVAQLGSWKAVLPWGADVSRGDTLTVGTRTFEVVAVVAPHWLAGSLHVGLEEVQG